MNRLKAKASGKYLPNVIILEGLKENIPQSNEEKLKGVNM
jgi:hypothetical protein